MVDSVDEFDAAVELIVDAEDLISEVKIRPELWDNVHENYTNKEMRKRKWDEIVQKLFKVEDATAEMKLNFGRMVQRKWKSLRDCYSRELRHRAASVAQFQNGKNADRKSPYIFAKQMSFLEKARKPRNSTNVTYTLMELEEKPPIKTTNEGKMSEQNPSISIITPDTPDTSSAVTNPLDSGTSFQIRDGKRRKRKFPQSQTDIEFIESVLRSDDSQRDRTTSTSDEESSDKLFLLSLVEPMKKIPEPLRFGLRLQIMQVIYNTMCGNIANNFLNPNNTND